MIAGGRPGEISPRWPQARMGVTGGQGNRNGTRSQVIANFFHKNKWVSRIVYSTVHILDPRPLPCTFFSSLGTRLYFSSVDSLNSEYIILFKKKIFALSADVRCSYHCWYTHHNTDSCCSYHDSLSLSDMQVRSGYL